MPKQPSQAEYFHARLNPATSPADAKALEIIHDLIARKWNFKEIAVDAILRAGGIDPVSLPSDGLTTSALEQLLTQFENRIVERIKAAGGYVPDTLPDEESDDSGGSVSPFARKFARGVNRRADEP